MDRLAPKPRTTRLNELALKAMSALSPAADRPIVVCLLDGDSPRSDSAPTAWTVPQRFESSGGGADHRFGIEFAAGDEAFELGAIFETPETEPDLRHWVVSAPMPLCSIGGGLRIGHAGRRASRDARREP